jgi:hypothetical protein
MEYGIITAKDYAQRERALNVKDRIKKMCDNMVFRGVMDTPFVDCEPEGKPIEAEINFGQWVARCDNPGCNGCEAVDPDEPIFYCFSCGNSDNHGKPKPVVFPRKKDRKEIAELLLERPIKKGKATHNIERITVKAVPLVFDELGCLSRSWFPGETVDDIKEQNKSVKAYKKMMEKANG